MTIPGPSSALFNTHDEAPSLRLFLTALQAATSGDSEQDDVPAALHRLLAPHRAHLQELRPIGQGAFGHVVLALNKIENRLTALKRVRFNSSVLPWAPADVLEEEHERLLREVRALAALQGCAQVVAYYHAWIEPDWGRLAARMRQAAPHMHPNFSNAADIVSRGATVVCSQECTARKAGAAGNAAAAAAGVWTGHAGRGQVFPDSSAGSLDGDGDGAHGGRHRRKAIGGVPALRRTRSLAGPSRTSSGRFAAAGVVIEAYDSPVDSGPGSGADGSGRGRVCRGAAQPSGVQEASSSSPHSSSEGEGHGRDPLYYADGDAGDAVSMGRSSGGGSFKRRESNSTGGGWWAAPLGGRRSSAGLSTTNGSTTDGSNAMLAHAADEALEGLGGPAGMGHRSTDLLGHPARLRSVDLDASSIGFNHQPGVSSAPASSSGDSSDELEGSGRVHRPGRGQVPARRRAAGARSSGIGSSGSGLGSSDDDESEGGSSQGRTSFHPDRPVPYVLFISMEFVDGCALDEWIWQRNHGGLVADGDAERRILRDVLLALHHIHARDFLHRDLKPSNVLVTQDERGCVRAKVGDLGLSVHQDRVFSFEAGAAQLKRSRIIIKEEEVTDREDTDTGVTDRDDTDAGEGGTADAGSAEVDDSDGDDSAFAADGAPGARPGGAKGPRDWQQQLGQKPGQQQQPSPGTFTARRHTNGVGTLPYQAPEQRARRSSYGAPADMWALGVLLVELFSSFTTGSERAQALMAAQRGRLPQALHAKFPEAAEMAAALLQHDPAARPTPGQLLRNPWLAALGDADAAQGAGAQPDGAVGSQNVLGTFNNRAAAAPGGGVHVRVGQTIGGLSGRTGESPVPAAAPAVLGRAPQSSAAHVSTRKSSPSALVSSAPGLPPTAVGLTAEAAAQLTGSNGTAGKSDGRIGMGEPAAGMGRAAGRMGPPPAPLGSTPSLGTAMREICQKDQEIASLKRQLTEAQEQLRRLSTSDLSSFNATGTSSSGSGEAVSAGNSTSNSGRQSGAGGT